MVHGSSLNSRQDRYITGNDLGIYFVATKL